MQKFPFPGSAKIESLNFDFSCFPNYQTIPTLLHASCPPLSPTATVSRRWKKANEQPRYRVNTKDLFISVWVELNRFCYTRSHIKPSTLPSHRKSRTKTGANTSLPWLQKKLIRTRKTVFLWYFMGYFMLWESKRIKTQRNLEYYCKAWNIFPVFYVKHRCKVLNHTLICTFPEE